MKIILVIKRQNNKLQLYYTQKKRLNRLFLFLITILLQLELPFVK